MLYRRFLGLLALLFGVLGLLTGCQSTPTTQPQNGKIKIMASLDFYGQTAKKVAGKYGQVTTVINRPSMDPHSFEPTVETAKLGSSAALIIYNGLGYDDWMQKLTVNKAANAKVLEVGTTVADKRDGANEHVWYDPTTMPQLATKIAATLAKIQPQHRAYFNRQAKAYRAQLKPVNQELRTLKQKTRGKRVAVSEPVFDYSLKALGFKITNQHFAKAIEEGADPSPKDIKQMQTAIRHHQIDLFVENTQTDSNVINNMLKLAKQYDIPILKVTETLPAHQTYEGWMLSQYQQLNRLLD